MSIYKSVFVLFSGFYLLLLNFFFKLCVLIASEVGCATACLLSRAPFFPMVLCYNGSKEDSGGRRRFCEYRQWLCLCAVSLQVSINVCFCDSKQQQTNEWRFKLAFSYDCNEFKHLFMYIILCLTLNYVTFFHMDPIYLHVTLMVCFRANFLLQDN